MLAGWILYTVIAGGVLGVDLTIELERLDSYNECQYWADELQKQEYETKSGSTYDYYCAKDPSEQA